jgi:hypothetical protein
MSVVPFCINVHLIKVGGGYEIIGTVMLRVRCLFVITIVVSKIVALLG